MTTTTADKGELLPLPEPLVIRPENKGYPIGIGFTADQMREYALANLQAAKPAETCNYPDCNCPFDAPADPSWCARGLPKANGLDLRAAIDATTKQEDE